MQPDLQKLYFTQEDLKNIAGVSNWDLKAYTKLKYPRLSLLLLIGDYLQQILILGWGFIPIAYLIKWKWLRKFQKNILEKVDKYNVILKAIDINDQLVEAGNKEVSSQEREQVIAALTTTRANLICALKTERIFRKNRAFIARNTELLASDLSDIQALQFNHDAHEYSQLLIEALQVAQEVQEEMTKLEED